MMMAHRLRLSLVLLFAFLLGPWSPSPAHAEPVGTLRVDGIGIGMSYRQVLSALGRPKVLREKAGLVALIYPAPRYRPEGTEVWFDQSRVVYCSGYTLEEDGEPLHLFGLPGALLQERFGPTEDLQLFASWWPESGIVLAGSNNIWPDEPLKAPLALRDPDFPLLWVTAPDGRQISKSEPWVDDEQTTWLAGDVELGMPQEIAQRLAGDLEVVYRGGFVQAIEQPSEALWSHRRGHQDLSISFEVGEPPQPFGPNPPSLEVPNDGWYSPASSGRVRVQGGKVAEIMLELDAPELFDALEALAVKP